MSLQDCQKLPAEGGTREKVKQQDVTIGLGVSIALPSFLQPNATFGAKKINLRQQQILKYVTTAAGLGHKESKLCPKKNLER